jgi:hypothetical protein
MRFLWSDPKLNMLYFHWAKKYRPKDRRLPERRGYPGRDLSSGNPLSTQPRSPRRDCDSIPLETGPTLRGQTQRTFAQ